MTSTKDETDMLAAAMTHEVGDGHDMIPGRPRVIQKDPSVMDLMRLAIESGPAGVDALERLVALQEKMDAKKSEAVFVEALSQFQSECPAIPRTSKVNFVSREGTRVKYEYAKFEDIAKHVGPYLKANRFSYSFDSQVNGDKMKVTITLRHAAGHSVAASFECPTDSKAGMSGAQRYGSALTYAKRQCLISALGLATCDEDLDGAEVEVVEKITEQKAMDLEALITEVGADRAKFLGVLGCDKVEDVPLREFDAAVAMLELKRKKNAEKKEQADANN